jgi:hypothetical protein
VKEQNKRKPGETNTPPGDKKPDAAKVIRLDDLAPPKGVKGGGKTFFGGK